MSPEALILFTEKTVPLLLQCPKDVCRGLNVYMEADAVSHEEGFAGGDWERVVVVHKVLYGGLNDRQLRAGEGAKQGDVGGELVDLGWKMLVS